MRKLTIIFLLMLLYGGISHLYASSHREAPLIANDPLADNTDLYAFRSPDNPNSVTVIANFIPGQLPQAGPNWYTFGENIRYEIHIDNDVNTPGDDIIYRATFTQENEDPTTFFNIRLGAENLKTTYILERSTDGGATFMVIVNNGIVPPPNIGPRSIESAVGLGADNYESLMQDAITTAMTGEKVYCGPAEDPFFVDLGAVFDLGNISRLNDQARDGLAGYNVHSIALQIPITTLQKEGKGVDEASNILDGDFVIGVWSSASRPAMRTLMTDGSKPMDSGDWVQVSRIGMPLTNEAVIPVGSKDRWNFLTPYNEDPTHFEYFYNPELGLYMDDDLFGGAVPALAPLRIQTASLAGLLGDGHPGFDFSNGADGLYPLKGNPVLDGTALDDAVFGTLLLPEAGKPRSVDLWPAFHTGVPNAIPYQLATGKMGNPLNAGKPFVNNFLPNGGDMLRLNMAVPATPRGSANFSALGLVQAAVLGLTDANYNSSTDVQFIPNMDGFPNGRRLEDDVTRIELQAVAGVVLAAVGLWYDDFDATDPNASPLTEDLLNVITYDTGVNNNDVAFANSFPYLAPPNSGTVVSNPNAPVANAPVGLFVSNTATPGINVYSPTQNEIAQTSRSIPTDQTAGNGIFVDEANGYLFQLSLANSSVKIYDNAAMANGNTMPIAEFMDENINSGREIAYDPMNDVLYVASNTDSIIFAYNNPVGLSGMVTADRTIMLNGEPWGISIDLANDRLYVAKDKTAAFQTYDNISMADGMTMPTEEILIDGAVRTHGINYNATADVLVVTEIGVPSGAGANTDGGLFVFENISSMISSSPTMMTADRTIIGDLTLMGNPVDVDYDAANDLIYVAEKTNGGRILVFDGANDMGNVRPLLASLYSDVPEDIYYAASTNSIYASNAANAGVGIFDNAFEGWLMSDKFVDSMQEDGNGIFYDNINGYTVQLSRATSTIKLFDNNGGVITEFTDPNIVSGREIALDIAKQILYVASNSDSTISVYDNPSILSGTVMANRTIKLNGEPWGITFDPVSDRLIVAKDKTDSFQVYNNASTLDGSVTPDAEVAIMGAVRVHGITYAPDIDALIVTEIGAASGGDFNIDGGYFLIENLNEVLQSGVMSVMPDASVLGINTMLGNPVDVAVDNRAYGQYIYLAEKTNGGSLQIFDYQADGDTPPLLELRYPGIPEAIHLETSGVILP